MPEYVLPQGTSTFGRGPLADVELAKVLQDHGLEFSLQRATKVATKLKVVASDNHEQDKHSEQDTAE